MEAAQKPNGPRVSFNRDVHVKRIGTRPSDKSNYKIETTNLQPPNKKHLRRELPADLSEESIRKEAAHVLAQAEKIKCKAESGKSIPSQIKNSNDKIFLSNKFHSLPSRKKKIVEKPVTRSVSDASSKKSKKPSIFNLFSRKSDLDIHRGQQKDTSSSESSGRRHLVRSKSDAGSYKESKNPRKRNLENEELIPGNGKSSQLSPIIENAQKEEYFEELFNSERRKSEAITAQEKNATELSEFLLKYNTESKLSGNIGYTNHEDLDLVPSKAITETIQALQDQKTKSTEDMHSSQIPPQKPALTKGLTVNGMVKRLSMERFSPPPTILGPAFSYTRPNDGVIYAQLVEEERALKRPTAFNVPQRHAHNFKANNTQQDVLDHSHGSQVSRNEMPSRVIITPEREYFSPVIGPTMIRIEKSPSPWQQLSSRNLSDDDEGLGVETRKYFEDDVQHQNYGHSKRNLQEAPVTPINRSITPPEIRLPSQFDEINTLSRRRANLESRIRSRRFAPQEPSMQYYNTYPDEYQVQQELHVPSDSHNFSSAIEDSRFHKLRSEEIMNKYSPERSHLDMISPSKGKHHTSRYIHTKYFADETGLNRDVYEREEKSDGHDKPVIRESRRRERFNSPQMAIENNLAPNEYEEEPRISSMQNLNINDSYRLPLDNQKYKVSVSQINSSGTENWHNSLKRDKRQQRSFDKGDSGIENDIRKDTVNGNDSTKWRKRTLNDDVMACEIFLKKERRHTEDQHPQRKSSNFVYRERSIDDGSHFDPRLDKYPKLSTSTLRRNGKENQSTLTASSHSNLKEETLKQNKKVGSFQKVKLLFSGNRKKERETSVMTNDKSEISIDNSGIKDKYMVKEEEMRSRYREHRAIHQNELREPKTATDISMRRRLSTPKASPLLKRTSSETANKNSKQIAKNNKEAKPEKSSWFKSIDRRSRSKSKEKLDTSLSNDSVSTRENKYKTNRSPPAAPAPPIPPKNFRFFGDTDLDSNPPTISKAASTQRLRPSSSTFNRTQKYSQSAFHLDRINQASQPILSDRLRSSSLQHLDEDGTDETDTRKRRHYSRSRNLDDISESGSETEEQYHRHPLSQVNRTLQREKHNQSPRHEDKKKFERHQTTAHATLRRSAEQPSNFDNYNHKANALPKPLRSAERRFQLRQQERLPDSSGTEGESSMQSQRSIVYLHATTVGAIPVPYQSTSQRRRAASREDLRKGTLQPMTRSVSRSVSMLAPWKPKHMSEGYEINYSQEQNEKDKKLSTLPRKNTSTNISTSTLKRNKKPEQPTRSRKPTTNSKSKEDLSSIRHSSSLSGPKSNISSVMESRKETLRRK